jgi:DNA repair protein RadC
MYKLKVVREKVKKDYGMVTSSSAAIYEAFKDEFEALDREQFEVLHLDAQNHVLGREVISTGSLTASIVVGREVFKGALLSNSSALIFMHNHPSGNPSPSFEDKETTKGLKQMAALFDIKVLDHIIFGESSFYSMNQNGCC